MTIQNPAQNTAVQQRTRLRQLRSTLTESQRDRGALLMRARLYTWLNAVHDQAQAAGQPGPTIIAAFWPLPEEPDLRPLLSQWAEADIIVALPVVLERNAPLRFLRWTPDTPLQAGAYGIPEPVSDETLIPDVILTPTLGYTTQGHRLGYGGGYYDRTLAALRDQGHPPITIGIAWHCCALAADYVSADHDYRLDAILTEAGWATAAPHLPPGDGHGTPLFTYTV